MQHSLEVLVKIVAILMVAKAARYWYVANCSGRALNDVPRAWGGIIVVAVAFLATLILPFFFSPLLIGGVVVWHIDFKTRGRGLFFWIRGW